MTSFAESNHNYQWMFNLYQLVLCFPRREHLSEEDVVKNKVSNSQSFTTLLTFLLMESRESVVTCVSSGAYHEGFFIG